MVSVPEAETRQRVTKWMEEANPVLDVIRELLEESEELRGSVDIATRECERLHQEVKALTSESQQLRTERDDLAESFTRVMNEVLRLMNEMAIKLGASQKRSPLER